MPPRLAKTSWLQNRLDEVGDPALVAHAVEAATARAFGEARRELQRREQIVEYPTPDGGGLTALYLDHRPVEAVHSVKRLSRPGDDADFEAADALTEFEDYHVDAVLGRVVRLRLAWRPYPRCARVVYTAGYLDPDGLSSAVATEAAAGDLTLAVDAAVDAGATVVLGQDTETEQRIGVTAVTGTGPFTLTLDGALAADAEAGDTAAVFPPSAILPPDSLQHAIIEQAVWIYNTAGTGGFRQVELGEGGGSVSFGESKLHPSLRSAVAALPGDRKGGWL